MHKLHHVVEQSDHKELVRSYGSIVPVNGNMTFDTSKTKRMLTYNNKWNSILFYGQTVSELIIVTVTMPLYHHTHTHTHTI